MRKKLIRLTEQDLRKSVKGSVSKVLAEQQLNEDGLPDEICKNEEFKTAYVCREIRKIYNILEQLTSDKDGVSFKDSPNLWNYIEAIESVVDNVMDVMNGSTNGDTFVYDDNGDFEKPVHYNKAYKDYMAKFGK